MNGIAYEYFPKLFYWDRTLWETALSLDTSIPIDSLFYPRRFKLYKEIYIGDICDFDFSNFDYLILGDILEHIEVERAIELVNKIHNSNKKCLIAIPYMYPQGSHDGNIYETHHQPDLTHDVFLNRYSNMKCLFRNELYGYYINY
jgi:hypothetical protein